MPHVKGIRRDGFINVDDNIDFRGTVRGAGDGIIRPYGALDFYVDGTDGRDTHSGKSWNGAFATVQAAITAQRDQTTAKGDVIWIAPGTYAETLTGNLTKVQVIGATCGGMPDAVTIAPTADNAYAGTLAQSAFRNIVFKQSSSSNPAYGAIAVKLSESIIDNCFFVAVSDTANSVGIRIGAETDATWELMCWSVISNCLFGSTGAKENEFDAGICFGNYGNNENSATRLFNYSHIYNNRFTVHNHAIKLTIDAANGKGGIISHNWISSAQGNAGTSSHGIWACGNSTDLLCMVTDNRIVSSNDAIKGFQPQNVFHNYISEGGVEKEETDIV